MNRKLFALIITILMVLSMGIYVYADTSSSQDTIGDVVEDSAYISEAKWNTSSNSIDVVIVGDAYDLQGATATLILPDCSFKLNGDITNPALYITKALSIDGLAVPAARGKEIRYFSISFTDMNVPYGDNVLQLYVTRNDGKRVVLYKTFSKKNNNSSSSSSNNGGGTSTSSSETSSKQIAALKPHLIVDSYSYGEAVAGQDVPLTFTLKNTSMNKIMRNIVLAVKPSGDLRIKSASDTIYIDTIDPGRTVTKSLKFFLNASSKEEVQSVSLTSTFEYFDIDGENAVAGGDTVNISLAADTVERVKIQKIKLPDMIFPNQEQEVSYSVINSGFATLYNAEIKVVDEAGTEYADVYVGSIEPSKAVTSPDLYLTFPEAGEKNLKFVLSYENDKLQVSEVSKEFKAVIQPMPDDKPPMIDMPVPGESMPGEEKPQNPFILWGIIGGSVLVAIIVTVIIVKVVKKKRREREDEDI